MGCNDLHKDTGMAALGAAPAAADDLDPPPPVVEVALQSDPRQGFPAGGKLEPLPASALFHP